MFRPGGGPSGGAHKLIGRGGNDILNGGDGIDDLAMTTNGQLLAAQAERLAAAGLDRVTVSLDAIEDASMRRIIDTDVSVDVVLDAMDAADDAGLDPEPFAALCAADLPKALYLNPTFNNPTTAVMTPERRAAVCEIARRYNVPIIEDDPYIWLCPGRPLPRAAMAPELCF